MELFGRELATEQIIDFVRMQAPITRKRRGCYGCLFIDMALVLADEVEKLTRRAAPANEALTLDELRKMDGEPVFAIPLKKNADWIEHWAILHKDIVTANSIFTEGRVYFLHLKDYGKTWIAYARKPERSE